MFPAGAELRRQPTKLFESLFDAAIDNRRETGRGARVFRQPRFAFMAELWRGLPTGVGRPVD